MSKKDIFDVEITHLKNGKHTFDFVIDADFFKRFENEDLQDGQLNCQLNLQKNEHLIQTEYKIDGKVGLICDRSLEHFEYPISISEEMVFKFGNEFQEVSVDVIIIPRDFQFISFAQYIYDLICVEIPMKKIHPKFQNEKSKNKNEETIFVYSSDQKSKDEATEEETNTEQKTDPRWDVLKELKNKLK